jgi:hypothetical protein
LISLHFALSAMQFAKALHFAPRPGACRFSRIALRPPPIGLTTSQFGKSSHPEAPESAPPMQFAKDQALGARKKPAFAVISEMARWLLT